VVVDLQADGERLSNRPDLLGRGARERDVAVVGCEVVQPAFEVSPEAPQGLGVAEEGGDELEAGR